jgi:hypothetical protein
MPKNTSADTVIKKQLTELLTIAIAHATFEDAVENLALNIVGIKPNNLPYSIWQLVEHIRITQWDILEFSRNPGHESPKWPDEYWPKKDEPDDKAAWDKSLKQIEDEKDEFIKLINDPAADLYTPFKHGDGQNLLREALLIADHTSYHVGEIIVLRRLLDVWN